MTTYTVKQSRFPHFFFTDTASAPLWFVIRIYLGYEWLMAGWGKVMNPKWFGTDAGAALNGFVQGAIAKTSCAPTVSVCHPDVYAWYASFLQSTVLPNLVLWSNAVAVGEVLIGLGLIFGAVTGIAAFFGFFMNLNFLLAGTVSTNPVMLVLALLLMLAWRVAGYWGLDRFILPRLHAKTSLYGSSSA